ncbi:MAG: DUF2075 domain-containing protein [Bullifex sp.]|nr:DUF2075 domain-containing protein [Bullifex sp.]
MIIYKATRKDFIDDCRTGRIADAVKEEYEKHIGKANAAEVRSWESSLRCMASVLDTDMIDDYVTICAEYRLPNCSKRIDLIVAGTSPEGRDNVVIVELKQWEKALAEPEKKLVRTFVGGGERYVAHPSYQAWSYAVTLENYNEAVESGNIKLFPCAYLHNYTYFSGDTICDRDVYPEIDLAPLFFRDGGEKLRSFIESHVTGPSPRAIMEKIDNGRLRPSASLQDVLTRIMRGSREFVMLDDQKVFFENIMACVNRVKASDSKHVFVIEGGPGTGKSVLAINLLAEAVKNGITAAYVSKNSAPRNVYTALLAKEDRMKTAEIKSLFLSSGSFVTARENSFDALFVDEAHRLNEKSGMFHNQGENQIKEIIMASRISVFFIDERQLISSYDIGSVAEITLWADKLGARIHQGRLNSQFRCNGSDGYMSFLDDVLDISHEYYTFDPADYDITIADDPEEMMTAIRQKNLKDNKARMLAGYCWDWVSKNDRTKDDIVIAPSFRAQWNFSSTSTWAIDRDSVDQIGCIHTSQGLEFSYAGVIIGDDLRYENGKVITDFSARARTDQSLKGLVGKCRRKDPDALRMADMIIRNTYRTLLSRAMKGCIVYCTDRALADHFRKSIEENARKVREFYSQTVAEAGGR